MNWHNEQAEGIEAAIEAMRRLLTRLEPFQGVQLEIGDRVKLAVFQKPWDGTLYLLSGTFLPAEVHQLLSVGKQSNLQTFGPVESPDGSTGLSFYSPNQSLEAANISRQLLEQVSEKSREFAVRGVCAVVNVIPCDV